MHYGFFDSHKREYVITRPDTPAPWANYLGSPAYGAIISNNAGGYSFVKSGTVLTNRIDQGGTSTFVMMNPAITGLPHGSLSASRLISTNRYAVMGRATLSLKRITRI